MTDEKEQRYIFTISCPDRTDIVAAVAGFLADHHAITESSHFGDVVADLDAGPIIEQAVERFDHSFGAGQMTRVGRDIENVVLARAVHWHVEHRVLSNDGKTVVFK